MSVTLWRPTYDASPPTWRVLLVLSEKNVAFEEIKVAYDNKPAAFLEANPRGQVPALRVDDVTVFETAAILEFLDYAFPNPPLLSTDKKARAIALIRVQEASNYLMAAFMAFWRNQGDASRKKELLNDIHAELARWERYLETSGGQYFDGQGLSLADLSVYPYLAAATRGGLGMDNYPRLVASYESLTKRPTVKSTWPAAWQNPPEERVFAVASQS